MRVATAKERATFPTDYIGKAEHQSPNGFNPIFVQWTGADDWTPGSPSLFWSAKGLGVDNDLSASAKVRWGRVPGWGRVG